MLEVIFSVLYASFYLMYHKKCVKNSETQMIPP